MTLITFPKLNICGLRNKMSDTHPDTHPDAHPEAPPEARPEKTKTSGFRVVTTVLKGALKLFLRSQVSDIQDLEIDIQANDRQLLSGTIPKLSIFANRAVYQGLHLTSIQLTAENIRVNISSVLKGKPLKLLEVIPVSGKLILEESDLNASLSSALLSTALKDVLIKLIPEFSVNSKTIIWKKIILDNNQLILFANQVTDNETMLQSPLKIGIGLELLSVNELKLTLIEHPLSQSISSESEKEEYFDLGCDVEIEDLTTIPGKLTCCGRINVNP
jgi:LmeA-like phospholipid-binding